MYLELQPLVYEVLNSVTGEREDRLGLGDGPGPNPQQIWGMRMELREALVGTVVRVKAGHRKPELEGLVGVIEGLWGGPSYTVLDVRLDDGRSELFWFHQVEAAEAGGAPGWDPTRMVFHDGG